MLKADSTQTDEPFKYNPIILFESHADPITVDMLRYQIQNYVEAGYTGICLEQPEKNLEEAIRNLEFRLPMFDVVIEDIESGKNTFISEYVRNTYKEYAADFERQFKMGMQHKILLYKAILQFQKDHDGKPIVYGIDTGIETADDIKELVEIYRMNDFDNPNFNLVRDRAFAKNIAKVAQIHDGGIIIIMGADHFGLQRELLGVLTSEQSAQIKSFYHYSLDGSKFGNSDHVRGFKNGEKKSLKRYSLGLEIIDYSNKDKLNSDDYSHMVSTVLEKAKKRDQMKKRM